VAIEQVRVDSGMTTMAAMPSDTSLGGQCGAVVAADHRDHPGVAHCRCQ